MSDKTTTDNLNNQIAIDNLINLKQLLVEEVSEKNEQIDCMDIAIEFLNKDLKDKKDKAL